MKGKSVSVENLENLLEGMIDGALRDDDELEIIMPPDRTIHKWYPTEKVYEESKSAEWKQQAMNISTPVAGRRFRKSKRTSALSRTVRDEDAKSHLEQSFLSNVIEQYAAVVNDTNSNHLSSETSPTSVKQLAEMSDRMDIFETTNTKPIEISKYSTKRSNVLATSMGNVSKHDHRIFFHDRLQNRQRTREKLSFEAWKKKKTNTYRQLLEKIEAERQQKLLENLANAEWKKIIQQIQIRKKRQELRNQRNEKLLSNKHLEAIKRRNVRMPEENCNRDEEKPSIAGKCASNVEPREQKEKTVLDEKSRRIMSTLRRRSNNTSNKKNRKNKTILMDTPMRPVAFPSTVVYSWLNQLNSILRNKYLRERCQLVRSFYCY